MKVSRSVMAAAAAVAFSVAVAGCSSSSGGDSATSAEASAPATSAPAEPEAASSAPASSASAGDPMAEAQAEVARLAANPPLEIAPLSSVPDPGYKVASVTCNISSCYPGAFEAAATTLGWEATEETYDLAKGPSDFVSAVRRALETKPQALAILFVYPPDIIKDELAQAKADGVVLIDIASALDQPPPGFTACVLCNAGLATYGTDMATWVAVDDNGGNAEVGVVGDYVTDANRVGAEASTAEIERLMPGAKVEQIEVSYTQTPQENAQTVITALQRNPGIKYLIYQSPDLMAGIDQALAAAGVAESVKIIAPGPTTEEQLMSVTNGFPTAWIGMGGPSYWWDTVDILARNLAGVEFNPTPPVPTRLITAENASPDLLFPTDYEQVYKQAWGVQ